MFRSLEHGGGVVGCQHIVHEAVVQYGANVCVLAMAAWVFWSALCWNTGGTSGWVGINILTPHSVMYSLLDLLDNQRVAREIKILKSNLHMNVIQLFEVCVRKLDWVRMWSDIYSCEDPIEYVSFIWHSRNVPHTDSWHYNTWSAEHADEFTQTRKLK